MTLGWWDFGICCNACCFLPFQRANLQYARPPAVTPGTTICAVSSKHSTYFRTRFLDTFLKHLYICKFMHLFFPPSLLCYTDQLSKCAPAATWPPAVRPPATQAVSIKYAHLQSSCPSADFWKGQTAWRMRMEGHFGTREHWLKY